MERAAPRLLNRGMHDVTREIGFSPKAGHFANRDKGRSMNRNFALRRRSVSQVLSPKPFVPFCTKTLLLMLLTTSRITQTGTTLFSFACEFESMLGTSSRAVATSHLRSRPFDSVRSHGHADRITVAREILGRPATMNIHRASLFPDLQGYAQFIENSLMLFGMRSSHYSENIDFESLERLGWLG